MKLTSRICHDQNESITVDTVDSRWS